MTREAEIRQTACEWLRNNHPTCTQDMLVEAFRCGAEWADKHPKCPWISVEERLPEKTKSWCLDDNNELDKVVLCRTKYGVLYTAYLDADEIWREYHSSAQATVDFTHWMEIPELKKGGKE